MVESIVLLVMLLLPLELFPSMEMPVQLHVYENAVLTGMVELSPDKSEDGRQDGGLYKMRWDSLESACDNSLCGDYLIERSRRRSSLYTVYQQGSLVQAVDLIDLARRIPHDFASRLGRPDRGFVLSLPEEYVGQADEATGQADEATKQAADAAEASLVFDMLPDMLVIRYPAKGLMIMFRWSDL